MNMIPIDRRINNLEILSKLMNSVAKQCGCRVKYDRIENVLYFIGDATYKRHIAEETLEFFRTAH
jgi:hypothetical protein